MGQTLLYAFSSVIIVSLISLVGLATLSIGEARLRRAILIFVGLAIGALLGDAFIHLIPEALENTASPHTVSLLVIAGMLLFLILENILHWHHGHGQHGHSHRHEEMAEPSTDRILPIGRLILVSDSLHNFLDGIIIGTSYLVSIEIGIASTIAILLHEIPQEIGDFAILLHAGYRKARALWVNFLSALFAIGGVALVFVLGSANEQFTSWILPLAAGSFIYIASSDLVPELHKHHGSRNFFAEFAAVLVGVGLMYLVLFLG